MHFKCYEETANIVQVYSETHKFVEMVLNFAKNYRTHDFKHAI
jgi:hypothetical protein